MVVGGAVGELAVSVGGEVDRARRGPAPASFHRPLPVIAVVVGGGGHTGGNGYFVDAASASGCHRPLVGGIVIVEHPSVHNGDEIGAGLAAGLTRKHCHSPGADNEVGVSCDVGRGHGYR